MMRRDQAGRILPAFAAMLLAHALVPAGHAQPATLAEVGKPAPALQLKSVLCAPKGPASVDWAALKGNVVVLEFWATWCGPCIMTMPHLNQLVSEFDGQPVRFISITDQDEQTVGAFLSKHELKGWIGLDRDGATSREYGVLGIPKTVLIGPDGGVLGIMIPEQLTAQVIRAVLAGERPALPDGRGERALSAGVDPDERRSDSPPVFQVVLRRSSSQTATIGQRPGKITADGFTVPQLICLAWPGYSSGRIVLPEGCDTGRYTLVASMPAGQEAQLQPTLRQMLTSAFGIGTHAETKVIDTATLSLPHGPGPGLKESAPGRSVVVTQPGYFKITNQPGRAIAAMVGGELGVPTTDHTGLGDELYDLECTWDKDDPKARPRSFLAAAGIQAATEPRPMNVLVVELTPPTSLAHE